MKGYIVTNRRYKIYLSKTASNDNKSRVRDKRIILRQLLYCWVGYMVTYTKIYLVNCGKLLRD